MLGTKKDYPRALADYTQSLQLDPSQIPVYLNRGTTHLILEDHPRALADFDHALDLDPSDATAYYNRGAIHMALEDYSRALADYKRTLELDPSYAEAYYSLGLAHLRQKDSPSAITNFDRFLQLAPSSAKAYFQRGQAYVASGVYQRARLDYERAFALDHAETMSLFQATLPLLDRALERDPSDAKAYFNRMVAHAALKDEASMLTDLERASELDPSISVAMDSYTHIKFEHGDFDRAVQLSPSHPFVYISRGCAYYKIKDYPRVIADFDRAIQLDPADAKLYIIRGMAYILSHDVERAATDFDHALMLDPSIVNSYGRYIYPRLEGQPDVSKLDRVFEQNISVLTWQLYSPQSEE